MVISILFILAGLVLLVGGGEALVRGSVALASRLGMSKALIGVTLVGFGTSMPEFVASFGAAAKGSPDLAFGNVLGSNTANILFILGIAVVICPIATRLHGLWRDAGFVMFASLASLLWIYLGGVPLWGAIALIAAFVIYMFITVRGDIADEADVDEEVDALLKSKLSSPVCAMLALGGIGVLVLGADLLIRGSSTIAREFGVSEAIIGITIVGVGTSLPEAAASIIASLKKENELAFANIVGSNIFNGLAIMGVTSAVFPMQFSGADTGGFTLLDGFVLVGATAAMFFFALTHKKIMRWEGALMLGAYLLYLAWLVSRAIAG